ncbi:oxidoreductase, short chain dehydrogenase/reductase family protein [Aeromicrobium marinum DSM 15272]|uniref:Oxidoreductase, short chain dehydrogenase/reductase family protein n=1 Tax=Aeromicrobium marinum DSM 15272 TaxID=585531 RepID=E2S8C1_9ACTN|nr:SDR family oxidoreductase [Aeromicrobium marinum]EFQ84426.1 oxidoreductase, short chain dehydrogenase/reductase family protein [Aeromicrobium marinum DSM 15272]
MAQKFNGKVLLVTGAARGIGAGVARGYVARGGKVALLGLEPDLLGALAAELGDAAAWWEADARDGAQMTAAIDAAAAHFGRIDHVLANAGIASYGTVRQIDEASFERVIDINVTGVYRTLHPAIPHLVETKGHALVVASLASFSNLAGLAAYNASKAGAESLALATAQEVAHLGVKVGVVHPGWIDTDIVRGAEADLPTFKVIRGKLPYPANSTTNLADCVDGILRGFARRKTRVYVPRGVVLANWTKPLLNSPPVLMIIKRIARRHVPDLEREVDALGRFQHAHVPLTEAKPAD